MTPRKGQVLNFVGLDKGLCIKERNSEKDANWWLLSNVQLQFNNATTCKCAGTCVSPHTRGHWMMLAR